MKKLFFFLGKGGVGKTTLAGSFSTYLARSGSEVFLASIDPAHNLFDFFGMEAKKGPFQVSRGLTVEEFDIDAYLKKFLRESSRKMKKTYHYLQMINLENMFDVLKHSPGMEEYAMLSALQDLLDTWESRVDYIVIDTPPTGLMLKIFSIPKATLLWVGKLKELRLKILERRSQVVHIKGKGEFDEDMPCEVKEDFVFKELQSQEELSKKLINILGNSDICKKILVLNYDELSVKEGVKIINDLKSLDISVDLSVFNKKGMTDIAYDEGNLGELLEEMGDFKRIEIPFYRDHVTPRDKMLEIAKKFSDDVL